MKTLQTDVLVCGGCGGIATALASARAGAKMRLIERAAAGNRPQPPERKDEPFVRENDYPFFGAEPREGH